MTQKVLFITGAGSGLGLLSAKRALENGWAVAAMDINVNGLDQLGNSPRLLKLVVDITDPIAVEAAVERCETELGPITRLTNAAAIMPLGLLMEQPRDIIQKIMSINFGGMVNLSKAALPRMIARGNGEFVSYASMAGHWPILYMGAYNAAKHAVTAYTEVLFHETRGSGVRIVCVCPPIVATPLLDQAKSTVWPKIFDIFPPITPECVLDKIESVLKGKKLWVFPGPMTAMSWRLRRWLPNTLWWTVHRVENI
ncbi:MULTISPECIES: SDR family oxidoreductase [unclassified Pseudomonas]|uniref:SDR family NAD(P)-dependent oxidoreductase n=1 Tax=unclassified Pseudomonas TaxID=196821 RepID=UPI000C87F1E8|nr:MULTISPECIES: SDR family oxidoreductase [unclassified Pseudomonas]PMX27464.1 short-chain dehydrogenase [Pseudomonas sp. GW460-12]PMX34468.1 short-chain dehydrogenase [Pseudomonas sp. MPR-R2A4]PMX41875.1 short-chain dehydrogenase [Pseudomonas sp. MPR-R2A7]PMX53831.1 short-chain dehydrogenase [Pseudomonas sp. MPR-R2A6]PMX91312.1 short-chain dehydrogenase [Pseudomonas sp. MPR-R2A3]